MGKMTKEQLQKRKAELKKLVHAEITKREVMQFRLEPENIDKLYQIALKQRVAVGTLVREWIIERINAELKQGQDHGLPPAKSKDDQSMHLAIAKLRSELREPLDEIMARVSVLENITQRQMRSHK
jgi:hypothetical protein